MKWLTDWIDNDIFKFYVVIFIVTPLVATGVFLLLLYVIYEVTT